MSKLTINGCCFDKNNVGDFKTRGLHQCNKCKTIYTRNEYMTKVGYEGFEKYMKSKARLDIKNDILALLSKEINMTEWDSSNIDIPWLTYCKIAAREATNIVNAYNAFIYKHSHEAWPCSWCMKDKPKTVLFNYTPKTV